MRAAKVITCILLFTSFSSVAQVSDSSLNCMLRAIDEFKPIRIQFWKGMIDLQTPNKPEYDELKKLSIKMRETYEDILSIMAKEYIKANPDLAMSVGLTFQPTMRFDSYFNQAEINEMLDRIPELAKLSDEYDAFLEQSEGTQMGQPKPEEDRSTSDEIKPELDRLGEYFMKEKERVLSKCK